MSSREEFEAWFEENKDFMLGTRKVSKPDSFFVWQASRAHESDLLTALIAITNSGPDAIPIKEAFEMAHRAIERALAS
jgi:hypothetical protein